MTNEEKVEKYFSDIEKVFGTKEQALNLLERYDQSVKDGHKESIDCFDRLTVGRHQKEYWVKFQVNEPELLNSFLMGWVVQGLEIAGVQGSVLDFGGVCNKSDLKNELIKFIETL